jgi:hypothetical protein
VKDNLRNRRSLGNDDPPLAVAAQTLEIHRRFVTRYLRASRQLKPEIMAKAEKLMITGYQRELTYRRSDGSFSAFGQSDSEGSLWLTGFVLKSFAQARDIIYVDQAVLDAARSWITARQNADGSFDQVGFVHHQEMIGGLKGKTALTAYTAIALMQAGDKTNSARAVSKPAETATAAVSTTEKYVTRLFFMLCLLCRESPISALLSPESYAGCPADPSSSHGGLFGVVVRLV